MPKKSNRNPGIEKRGNKWRARAFYDGSEKTKTFATQDEALRWKRETQRALERGEWIDPSMSSITFADWSEKWLAAKTNISASTRRGYVARLQNHLLPRFGHRKLTTISNNEIGQWLAKSIEQGAGVTALRQSYGVLRQIMNAALLDGRIYKNPALGVKLPKKKSKDKQPLTLKQLSSLASQCGAYETLVLFAGTTGLRWGEIAALQSKDVSVLNRNVKVTKSVSIDESGKKRIGNTKTHQDRVVPVPREIINELEKRISIKRPEQFLFEMPEGGQLDYHNFMNRVFRPALAALGLEGFSFHSLRHTTASLLISQGAPVTTVAGILGHASTQMTLDVYGHLYGDDSAKYVDRLGDSLVETRTDKERTNVLQVKAQS